MSYLTSPVIYIGKSVGSCASVKESMRSAVRFPMTADFRDLNLGLARSFAGDLKWRGIHSNGRAVVKVCHPHRVEAKYIAIQNLNTFYLF